MTGSCFSLPLTLRPHLAAPCFSSSSRGRTGLELRATFQSRIPRDFCWVKISLALLSFVTSPVYSLRLDAHLRSPSQPCQGCSNLAKGPVSPPPWLSSLAAPSSTKIACRASHLLYEGAEPFPIRSTGIYFSLTVAERRRAPPVRRTALHGVSGRFPTPKRP